MRRLVHVLIIMLLVAGAMAGCKKKEEPPVPKAAPEMPSMAPMAPMGQEHPAPGQMPAQSAMPPHGNMNMAGMTPKVEKTIVVPDAVKGKWNKVVLTVEDKTTKKTQDYTVPLKSDFKIPNTTLKVAVGDFLPDFKMSESTFTSGSNDPLNPAVRVEIFEAGKSVFKGWLYSKFPTMHPFEHPKYAVLLKEGIKR